MLYQLSSFLDYYSFDKQILVYNEFKRILGVCYKVVSKYERLILTGSEETK